MVRQIGFFMPLTQPFAFKNTVVLETGKICAWDKSAWHSREAVGGSFAALGLSGTNNYGEMWRERRVYGEPVSGE